MNSYLEPYLLNNLGAENQREYANCEWRAAFDDYEEQRKSLPFRETSPICNM